MKENYYALLICILKPVTVEQGFNFMAGKTTKAIIKDDIHDMIAMKQQGMTFEAIGELYGLTKGAVYRRLKRFREKEVTAV